MKKKFPDTFIIIFILIVIAALLTYIIPGGEYEKLDDASLHYEKIDSQKQSWQIFTAFSKGFIGKSGIIVFVLIVGGFFSIINSTQAINVGVFALLRKLSKFENKYLTKKTISLSIVAIIMFIFSLFGSTFGMSEETIAFVGITIPLAISMGFDSITGLVMVFVGAALGFAGAFINPFTVGVAQDLSGLAPLSGINYRIFCWIIITTSGITFVLWHANKVFNTPAKSPTFESDVQWKNKEFNPKSIKYHTPVKAWIVFALSIIVLLAFALNEKSVYFLSGKLKPLYIITAFYGIIGFFALKKSVHYYILTILTFIIVFLVYGVMFYDWGIARISALFFAGGILTGIAVNRSGNEIVQLFMSGFRDILGAAIVIGLAGGILVIMKEGKIIHPILYYTSNGLDKVGNVAAIESMYLIQTLINIFIPSGSAQASITIPILAPLSDLIGISRQATVMAFQFGDGFTNMITPTSPVLMAVLGVAKLPYSTWFKWVLPLLILLTIIGISLLIPTVSMDLKGF